MTEAKNNKPVANVRIGSVTASIWENKGDKGSFLSASFQRSYKDKDGNWKNSESFGPTALLELAKAADAAHTRILKLYADMPRGAAQEETPDDEGAF